jgi:hypothetical protein
MGDVKAIGLLGRSLGDELRGTRRMGSRSAADRNNGPHDMLRRGLPDLTRGYAQPVTIGTSILLIAVGAILKYAVTADVSGIDLQTVGVILMLVGILGLVLSLLYTFMWSDAARQRRDPADPHDQPTRRF